MGTVLDLLGRLSALVAPLVDRIEAIRHAPLYIFGCLVFGGVYWVWTRLDAAAQRNRLIDDIMKKIEPLLAKRTASDAPTAATTAQGNPREELRNALDNLLRSDDPRGAEVARLVTRGETERAATVSRAIAEDSEAVLAQLDASASAGRKAAAQKWRYAGAVAFLTATKDAAEAYEKAHALDPDDTSTQFNLALLCLRMGKFNEAVALLTALSQDGRTSFEERYFQASALGCLGVISQIRGDFAQADVNYRSAFKIFEEIGAGDGQANQLVALSDLHRLLGNLDAAEQMAEQALTFYEAAQQDNGMASALSARGAIAVARDNIPLAEVMFERALSKLEKLGNRVSQANALANLAYVARLQGKFTLAVSRCRKSIEISTALENPEAVAVAQVNLGAALVEQGDDLLEAEKTLTKALTTLMDLDSREFQYYARAQLARILWKQGQKAEAAANWKALLAKAAEAKVEVITKELRRILAAEGLTEAAL